MSASKSNQARAWCTPAIAALGASLLPLQVAAQTYPVKPIRLVSGFVAGGSNDIHARLLAPKMSELLGQNVIVENRAGAGGNLAAEAVAKRRPMDTIC